MDWLLIGELPTHRVGCNSVAEYPAFKPVFNSTPQSSGALEQLPTEHVEEEAFESLMTVVTDDLTFTFPEDQYWFHVKGHGSESGLKDGFLNTAQGFEVNDKDFTPQYSIHPRDRPGLGRAGDSGTWIFLENGSLLGQIHSYDPVKDLAYYTPMYKIFDHIKKVTRATDVRFPEEADYLYFGFDANEYGYGTPGDALGSPVAHKQSVRNTPTPFGAANTPHGC
jgi:hypothetical protein